MFLWRCSGMLIFQGRVNTLASSIVASYWIVSASSIVYRSITLSASLWKLPAMSNHVRSLWYFTSTTSLDYAETNPSVMIRSGNFADAYRPNDSHVAFSTDGGANWFQGSEPGGVNEGGTIAAAADGARFVWAPKNTAVHYTVGFGNTWTQSAGIAQNAVVESDRVDPNTFYGFAAGTFYRSTNGGATFTAAATGLPATGTFKAVPGVQGEIWLAGGTAGLFRSTDGGVTFTAVATVQAANAVGFEPFKRAISSNDSVVESKHV